MITFQVDDMTCGGCAGAITRAVKAADQDAEVKVDLAAHRVQVTPAAAVVEEIANAIKDAGFTPVLVPA